MFIIPMNHLELLIYSFMVLDCFKIQYNCQIWKIFTFWFPFAMIINIRGYLVDIGLFDAVCIYWAFMFDTPIMISMWVWNCHPWVFLIKSKMATIAIWAFIENDISRKETELETSFWCQTIYFWYQGIIWNCLFTLIRCSTAWTSNMVAKYVNFIFQF